MTIYYLNSMKKVAMIENLQMKAKIVVFFNKPETNKMIHFLFYFSTITHKDPVEIFTLQKYNIHFCYTFYLDLSYFGLKFFVSAHLYLLVVFTIANIVTGFKFLFSFKHCETMQVQD